MRSINKTIFLGLVVIIILNLIFVKNGYVQTSGTSRSNAAVQADSVSQIAAALPEHEQKIDWAILQTINKRMAKQKGQEPETARDIARGQNVKVLLSDRYTPADTTALVAKIVAQGGKIKNIIHSTTFNTTTIGCWLPFDKIKELAKEDVVGGIMAMPYRVTRQVGTETTIGDSQLNADAARSYFGIDGDGVKVGVISDGITNWQNSYNSGDLSYVDNYGGTGTGDEGTAMLEIIHDLAEGADLFFASAGNNPAAMATNINGLFTQKGCDIVVDDIGWIAGEPYFLESDLTNTIRNQVENNDKIYITAAGNDGQGCWDGLSNVDGNDWHYFSGTNINNTVVVENGETLEIYLQWANKWYYSDLNYDLFLYNANDSLLANGSQVQDGDQSDIPQEIIEHTNATGSSQTYSIRIRKMFTGGDKELKLVLGPSHTLNFTTNNQVYGHAATPTVISVAAYSSDTDEIADYSSRGPSNLYDSDGQTSTEIETPLITATAKVDTKVGKDGNFQQPFEGTSAAAPHIAGIAALYLEEHPTDTYEDFIDNLTDFASDIDGHTGRTYNLYSGYGKAHAYYTINKGISVGITVTQKDKDGTAFGQVGVYESSSFVNYSVPATFSWTENSVQTIRSDQNFKPGTTQKYHDWNELNDVVNHHSFTISPTTSHLTANFVPANNATIQSQLLEGGSADGSVEFKDPWLIDASDSKGSHNRGSAAVWNDKDAPFSPGTGTSYKGIFLSQEPVGNNPHYKVRVHDEQTINSATAYFEKWETSSATVTQPTNKVGDYYETPVIFNSANATVTAKYKGHMLSGTAGATAQNNQRKMVHLPHGV